MNTAPSTGHQGEFGYKIPSQSMFSPAPDIPPVLVSHEADFGFASGSEYHGLGYVMPLKITDPKNNDAQIASAAILFDVPWMGDNSLVAAFPQPGNLQRRRAKLGNAQWRRSERDERREWGLQLWLQRGWE